MRTLNFLVVFLVVFYGCCVQAEATPNPKRDILVTFDNDADRLSSAGLGAPYQHRKQYSIARKVRRDAIAVAK
jgi:hypothetical protein